MKLGLLVLTTGKQEGKTIDVKLPQFLIGRDPQCHLRPASALISKRHCALIQRDGKVFIRDFGSTNGTYVNDERVEGERELTNEDQLKIGPIHLVIRLEADAASPTTTPVPPTKQLPAKPVLAKSDTPAPATAKKSDSPEDDIAAMLLSLDDGDMPASSGSEGVPEGSTVFDMKVPEPGAVAAAANKDEKKKAASGDTRSAAASILEKMMKRPRNPT